MLLAEIMWSRDKVDAMLVRENEEALRMEQLGKRFPGTSLVEVLHSIDLALNKGEFLSIVGPSGCGKTTLLRIIAGLLQPTSGKVIVAGVSNGLVGHSILVFQDYARSLFPWRTVRSNVELALERSELSRREREQTADEHLNRVGLSSFRGHYPFELSGGMQQRLALARALAYKPELLLMDEPFGALDATTRESLEDLVLGLWDEIGFTSILVTHDVEEALYMAQKVAIMTTNPGSIAHILSVPLPYPRHQLTTREAPEFLSLRRQVRATITGG